MFNAPITIVTQDAVKVKIDRQHNSVASFCTSDLDSIMQDILFCGVFKVQ